LNRCSCSNIVFTRFSPVGFVCATRWLRLCKMAKMAALTSREEPVVDSASSRSSERNLVVHVAARGAGAGERRLLLPWRGTWGAEFGRAFCLGEDTPRRGGAAGGVAAWFLEAGGMQD